MLLMLAYSRSLQLAERHTILSCASILHVGAEAYGWLMPCLAPGNNIIKRGENKRKVEIREGLARRMNEEEEARLLEEREREEEEDEG